MHLPSSFQGHWKLSPRQECPPRRQWLCVPHCPGHHGHHVLRALSPLEITELDFSFSDSIRRSGKALSQEPPGREGFVNRVPVICILWLKGEGNLAKGGSRSSVKGRGGRAGQAGVPKGSWTQCFLSLGILNPQPTLKKRVRPGDKTALLGKKTLEDTEAWPPVPRRGCIPSRLMGLCARQAGTPSDNKVSGFCGQGTWKGLGFKKQTPAVTADRLLDCSLLTLRSRGSDPPVQGHFIIDS